MKVRLHLLSVCFLLLFAQQLVAQVSFQAKASKNRLGVNERLRVSFEMNKNGDNFTPPSFEGFSVVGGPNQSVSNSWLNGVRSFSKSYTYFLTPNRKGEITIGQASIEIDGEVYKTSPITIQITEAVNNPNSPQARANAIVDDNLHLIAEVSKSNPYLNEAISVQYKLYFSSEINVYNVNEVEMPKYTDFWSHQIPIQKLEIQRGEFKGQAYNYVTWRKTVLYPQKSGTLILEPLTLNVSVDVPTNRRDLFGNRIYQKTPKVITAGKRSIKVRPLPLAGRPADFDGAVGRFDLDVRFNKTELKSSESFQATIKISGRGNLKLFSLPKFNAPSSLEVYEPEHNEAVKTNLLGMQGSMEDVYTIVPQYQGKYPIPTIAFSFFDPVKEEYVRLRSRETVIDVYEGPVVSTPAQGNSPKIKSPVMGEPTFDFIKLETVLQPMEVEQFYGSTRFWIWLFTPLVLFVLALVVFRKFEKSTEDALTRKQKLAARLAKKYLSSAKKVLGKKERFYNALERALHNYLKAKLAIETSDFSKDRIAVLLNKKKASQTNVANFISVLEKCEAARYAPSSSVSMQEDFDLALSIITALDREI